MQPLQTWQAPTKPQGQRKAAYFPQDKANRAQLAEATPGPRPFPSAKLVVFREKIKGAQSKDKGCPVDSPGERRGNQCISRGHPGPSTGSPSPSATMRQLQVWTGRLTFFMCNFSSFVLFFNTYSDSKDIMPGLRLGFPYAASHQTQGGCLLSCQSNMA